MKTNASQDREDIWSNQPVSKPKHVVPLFSKESKKKSFHSSRKEYPCSLALNSELTWNTSYFPPMIINGMRKGSIIALSYKELNKIFNLVFHPVCATQRSFSRFISSSLNHKEINI